MRALEGEVAELRVEVAQLHRALATRTLIGQGTGVVMATLRCSSEVAWQAMRALSQDSNTPIRELAASIVDQPARGRIRELDALRPYLRPVRATQPVDHAELGGLPTAGTSG